MKKKASCPTCGTRLSKLHDPNMWRTCNACNRTNPRKYPYCGWCASPMENTEMRKKLSEVAAPPGGWPSLASELVEVRFFMERGNFADAFELLAILRQRYPLHPELEEFTESTRPSLLADTGVHQVVDGVMADSPGLSGTSVGRRPAPQWNAPHAKDRRSGMTGSHTTVPVNEFDDDPPSAPRRRAGKRTRRGHQPIAAVPVVPIIPPDTPVATPKKKRKKKRLMTHRYERAEGPARDEPQEVAPPVEEAPVEAVAPAVEEAPAPVAVEEAPAPVAVEEVPMVPRPAPVAEATPNLIEPGERERARAAGAFEVTDAVPHVPVDPPAAEDVAPTEVPPIDTAPLDDNDLEEVSQASGLYAEPQSDGVPQAIPEGVPAAVPEPEPDPMPEPEVDERTAAQIAAAKRAAAKRARKAARKAAADAKAAQRRDEDAVAAARQAVEEAVSDLTDGAPDPRTGRTHVGRRPEPVAEPAVTGDTAVSAPPSEPVRGDTAPPIEAGAPQVVEPAITGDTAVSAPPGGPAPDPVAASREAHAASDRAPARGVLRRAAPRVRVDTEVGLPPSAEPGYVPPKGLTLAVESLQPATPFDDPEKKPKAKKKGRGKGRKRSMKPRKRSGKTASVNDPQQQAERQERARKRAARFGQGILGK